MEANIYTVERNQKLFSIKTIMVDQKRPHKSKKESPCFDPISQYQRLRTKTINNMAFGTTHMSRAAENHEPKLQTQGQSMTHLPVKTLKKRAN